MNIIGRIAAALRMARWERARRKRIAAYWKWHRHTYGD